MKTLQNVQNLTLNDIKVYALIEIPNNPCTINSIRPDGKIYIESNITGFEYTTTLDEINTEGWKIINPE